MGRMSEKAVYVHNPLPALTDAEILAKAGLDDTATPHHISPVYIDWKYSFGEESDYIRLQPGDRHPMQAEFAREMMREKGEQGLVTYPLDADAATVQKACLEGVKRAITFWADRGTKRLTTIRKIHNLDRQAMEDSKHDHWSFYYAQATSDLLRESITRKPAKTKAA